MNKQPKLKNRLDKYIGLGILDLLLPPFPPKPDGFDEMTDDQKLEAREKATKEWMKAVPPELIRLVTSIMKLEMEDEKDENGNPYPPCPDCGRRHKPHDSVDAVYDIDQANFDHDPQLNAIVTGYKTRPRMHYYNSENGHSNYHTLTDLVSLKRGLDPKEHGSERRVVLHELAHSTGHKSRLGRAIAKGIRDQKTYSHEEIVAEMTLLKIMREEGILSPADLKVSNNYIRTFAKGFEENDGMTLGECRMEADKEATAAAEYILGRPLTKQRRPVRKAKTSPAQKELAEVK